MTRRFSAAILSDVLEKHVPRAATGLVVAVSGGADSSCLLTALAQLGAPLLRGLPVRAIHIDHGLQPAAVSFRQACEELCRRLDVPLVVLPVAVATADGESIEAAARQARYAGIAQQMQAGECLLTAHHAADQAETVLLQLLRGAGPKGLAAMPICRRFAAGWHVRPLLRIARQEILDFGRSSGVRAQTDPMNGDARFDRVYLRNEVWPRLTARWPGCETALARSARHLADAQDFLEQSAADLLQNLRDGEALSLLRLRMLSPSQQHNVLRHWISSRGAALPSLARLSEALRQMIDAAEDHMPMIAWDTNALRRYRDRLFLTAATPPRLAGDCRWRMREDPCIELDTGVGTLAWSAQMGGLDAARLPDALQIRKRRGGESLRPHLRAKTRSVQQLCQSVGIPPWLRDALPLIYAGDELIAVGDLWYDSRWCVPQGQSGWGCKWSGAPIFS